MADFRSRRPDFLRSSLNPLEAARRFGISLIELLVVLAIIGILIGLMLPAVQAARESARRASCENNAHQIALAIQAHEAAHRRLPSGGWGFLWFGDPDRGTGARQPGGWVYSLLPYVERSELAVLGKGLAPPEKRQRLATVSRKAIGIFNCPTRRDGSLSPFDPQWPPINADLVEAVAKSDYAINGGDVLVESWFGPPDLATGDSPSWIWPDFSKATGVCHVRSEIRLADIRDGQAQTYLIGEKSLSDLPIDPGDDQSMYVGYDMDTIRWTSAEWPPTPDSDSPAPHRFGSSHPAGTVFAFCDGSTRVISFTIDAEVHRRLGNRKDGLLIGEY